MTSRALHSLKSLNNSKLPDLTRNVSSIPVPPALHSYGGRALHLPCEFAKTLYEALVHTRVWLHPAGIISVYGRGAIKLLSGLC
jgi:hypothetical protein